MRRAYRAIRLVFAIWNPWPTPEEQEEPFACIDFRTACKVAKWWGK
jgi:hypothetical protein